MTEAEKTHWPDFPRPGCRSVPGEHAQRGGAGSADLRRDYKKEGAGAGVRYSAFDRYTKLAGQSLERMQHAQTELAAFVSNSRPLDSSEKQLQAYRQVYADVPWTDMEQTLHSGQLVKPPLPDYSDFVDRTVSGQKICWWRSRSCSPLPRRGTSSR